MQVRKFKSWSLQRQTVELTPSKYIEGLIIFTRGGAISLEANAKIYVFKLISPGSEPALNFVHNSAIKGGAIYVADETNFGTCSSTSFTENKIITECFLQ